MPQPAISLDKYLTTKLPQVKENFPAGGGATGPRKEYDTNLTGVSIIPDFESKVQEYIKTLPKKALPAHPTHPFPHFQSVIPNLPKEVKSAQDVQQYLRQLPLAATAASLSALHGSETGVDYAGSTQAPDGKQLDAAGYESDGGEVPGHAHEEGDAGHHKEVEGSSWGWKFSKSPLGSGEFLLVDEKNPDKIHLVVRTINSSAFAKGDWEEFVGEGPYVYNIKNKASWYHSRNHKASTRLDTQWFVFSDYQKWLFGVFDEKREHVNITHVLPVTATSPTILEALLYWTRSAIAADDKVYKFDKKDVSSLSAPYEENGKGKDAEQGGLSLEAESDHEE